MLEFLKKLLGIKQEEPKVHIPQEYIIPKKKQVIVDEPIKEETSIPDISKNDIIDYTQKVEIGDIPKYTIEQEWAVFEENNKYGYKDENGDKIIAAKFDDAKDFKNGYAIVRVKEKRGMINKKGDYILEPVYDYIEDEREGLLKVEKNNKCGFVNTEGKIIIPVKYLDAGEFAEDLVWVEKDDALVGFIDKNNKTVIDFVFDYCGDFSEGFASATKYALEEGQEDTYGFIDKTGKFVLKMDYDEAGDFKEGLAPVCIDGKYTFIDRKGKPVCPPTYNAAGNFLLGLSCVQLEDSGKWGYADKTGKLVIPYQFDSTSDYMDDEEALEFVKDIKLKYLNK